MDRVPLTSSTAWGHRSLLEAVVNDSLENRQTVCVDGFVGSAAVELALGLSSGRTANRPRVRLTQWGWGRWAHL